MFNETRKIMHTDARCSAMCVRVPSLRSHSEAVWVETEQPVSPEAFAEAIRQGQGVQLMDDPANKVYPMPHPQGLGQRERPHVLARGRPDKEGRRPERRADSRIPHPGGQRRVMNLITL